MGAGCKKKNCAKALWIEKRLVLKEAVVLEQLCYIGVASPIDFLISVSLALFSDINT